MVIGTGINRVCAFSIHWNKSVGFYVWGKDGREEFPLPICGNAKEVLDYLYKLIDTNGK